MLLKFLMYFLHYLVPLILIITFNGFILPLLQGYVCFRTLSSITITILMAILYNYIYKWMQLLVNLLDMFKHWTTIFCQNISKHQHVALQILGRQNNLESFSKLASEAELTDNTSQSIESALNVQNGSQSDVSLDANKKCNDWMNIRETDESINTLVIEGFKEIFNSGSTLVEETYKIKKKCQILEEKYQNLNAQIQLDLKMENYGFAMEQPYNLELRNKLLKVKRWCDNQKKSFRKLREEVIGNMSHSIQDSPSLRALGASRRMIGKH